MDNDKDKIVSLNGIRDKNKIEKKNKEKTEKPAIKDDDIVYCSFCGRPNTQVIKMVQGPGVNICSECTMIAVQYLILEDRMPSGEARAILDAFWSRVK